MPWAVWIGVSTAGEIVIGHVEIMILKRLGKLADSARIFPSQLGYRCAARVANKWRILTPTAARAAGARSLRMFSDLVIAREKARKAVKVSRNIRNKPGRPLSLVSASSPSRKVQTQASQRSR